MKAVTEFEVNESNDAFDVAVGETRAEYIIENECSVDVDAHGLSFLCSNEQGWIDLHLVSSVERQYDAGADEIVARLLNAIR